MAKKKPKQRLEDMKTEHWEIIEEMIGSKLKNQTKVKDQGLKIRNGRIAHKFTIDRIPYWIILAG